MYRLLVAAGIMVLFCAAGVSRADVPPPPGLAAPTPEQEALRSSLVGGAVALGCAVGGIWLRRRIIRRKESGNA